MNKYLIEVGVEELPSRYVQGALSSFKNNMVNFLNEENLTYSQVKAYATPRRLSLIVEGLADRQPDIHEEVRGPAKRIAYLEDGTANKPLLGFMKGQGITEEDIIVKKYKDEDYIFANIHKRGKSSQQLLSEHVPQLIKKIYFPRTMRWGGKNIRFARPIRWLASIFNDEVVPFEFEGIPVGNKTNGHRFLGKSGVVIDHVENYEEILEKNYVILDQDKRRDSIVYQANRLAKSLGGELKEDSELLEELTYIVEYPTAVLGNVDNKYLKLPTIVITTPMREHLRYIPVYKEKDELLPYFITIRNGDDRYVDIVAKGNEKVLAARLEDARFFFEEDLKSTLEEKVEELSGIVFQDRLGNMLQKTNRIGQLSKRIGEYLAVGETSQRALKRASYLAKSDLVTNMVQEFTELEGTMGKIYALENGEDELVAQAIEEQYFPRSSGGTLPQSTTGTILSISDKLDTLCGLFAIDKIPTGSQDPFGLRRNVIGILRMIVNKKWTLSMTELIDASLFIYTDQLSLTFDYEKVKNNILEFIQGRIINMLNEEDIRYDIVDAVQISHSDDILSIFNKAIDLNEFFKDDHKSFVEAAVRINNLASHYNEELETKKNEGALEISELELVNKFNENKSEIDGLIKSKDFIEALNLLDELTPVIHEYFDNNMILVDDEEKKANRLSLLHQIDKRMVEIFDAHKIVIDK